MNDDIAFLHTAATHVNTFGNLMAELAPDLAVRHVVDETLLAEARAAGGIGPDLEKRVGRAMINAAATGARVVVCTCSTIGGAAEQAGEGRALITQRIDRAMADAAVRSGPRILMVAALQSTFAPTRALILDSAVKAGDKVVLRELVVESAWPYFELSQQDAYISTIVTAIQGNVEEIDVIVLAQASMAPAVAQLRSWPVPVIASPRLGVKAAIAAFQRAYDSSAEHFDRIVKPCTAIQRR
jgi:hypothetical protein